MHDMLYFHFQGTPTKSRGAPMKFLALESEVKGATADQFQTLLQAEAARAYELYQLGIFRELYFDQERHTAVLMLECADLGAAQTALDSLPLVQAGLISFQLIPLTPYPGFSRLFMRLDHGFGAGPSA
jgi:hypothetical protein